ncbi:MAG: D-alanyl-D-alanine carboxypeptidase/D-alanyl-D-alanine-endopeptidase, partial [Nitrosomonadaceae bacterium]
VTTFAGLELLGPAYIWKTELYANGVLKGDKLQGDLVIKGYGDPRLNLENFWLLTRRLRQTGLREITGDLLLDNSYFNVPIRDPAAFDNKPYRAYNTAPEALLVNYRTMELRIIPQPASKTVRVITNPLPELIDLNNNLKLTKGKCNEWRNALGADIRVNAKGNRVASVTLNGSYSINCGERTLLLSLHSSPTYTLSLFRKLWKEQGGIFNGKVRTGTVPYGKLPLETHQSPPLAEIIRDINKFSNNIAARQLYLALGTATGNMPATLTKSNIAVRQWLASRKLDFPELIIENGSGLSRIARISTRHLGELLLTAFQSSVMPEFVSSLPISAVDGTLKKRLNGTTVTGQAHIKTGLLNGVKTMAGYMLDKSGRRVAVVFFVNHSKSSSAQPVMDMLLHWIYERP